MTLPEMSEQQAVLENHEEVSSTLETSLDILANRLAQEYVLTSVRPGKSQLIDNLLSDKKVITDAYRQFSRIAQDELPLPYAAEWLLDNFFVVQQTIRQIRQDLPRGYYRELPKLSNPKWLTLPRSYAIACELIHYSENHLDIEQAISFLRTFQATVPLTMGELWAFPTMLRAGILSSLAEALNQVMNPSTTDTLDDRVVRFCITSLRMLAVQDWKDFFESVSLVDEILRRDPTQVYALMNFKTSDCPQPSGDSRFAVGSCRLLSGR